MRRELVISTSPEEDRVVLLEDGRPVEIQVEARDQGLVGNVYLGRVNTVLPGMQAAFLGLGLERDCLLHARELLPERGASERIEQRVKPGDELIVQVKREPLEGKGARVSAQLALAGRFLVLVPDESKVRLSRKIGDEGQRAALAERLERLRGDRRLGLIVRTAAAGQSDEVLERDLAELFARHDLIRELRRGASAPLLLHGEPPLSRRCLRDHAVGALRRITVDDASLADELRTEVAERSAERGGATDDASGLEISVLDDAEDVFTSLGIEKELGKALRRKVWLKSGGQLVVDQLEAMVVVDVNTGKFVGTRDAERTVLKTNLEAAREVARQLRLRDLGGLVIVDFVDMTTPEHRDEVLAALEEALDRDRARTTVLGMSEFCLVQLTRQRKRRSLDGQLLEPCPSCRGSGRVRSAGALCNEILRRLRAQARREPAAAATVRAHPSLIELVAERRKSLAGTDDELRLELTLTGDESLPRWVYELGS
ncbi:MAG: Rne/Rng family ribonuclease [Acidobacteriota bacterium]